MNKFLNEKDFLIYSLIKNLPVYFFNYYLILIKNTKFRIFEFFYELNFQK